MVSKSSGGTALSTAWRMTNLGWLRLSTMSSYAWVSLLVSANTAGLMLSMVPLLSRFRLSAVPSIFSRCTFIWENIEFPSPKKSRRQPR